MKHLSIAPGLALPLDAVAQTFGILAVRGAGKSNTARALAEEMHAAGLPFVAIDPVGSWWGLRSAGEGGAAGIQIPIFGGRHGDVPLEKTGGQLLADLVVDQRLSCVIDVSEFSEGDKTRFLIDFAERLYRRNTEPLHLFLEEADDYIPQRPMREQARCLRAFENIVRRGRARGLGITLITQRSAAINKNVLTQVETLIIMRTTSPQDRAAVEAWIKYHNASAAILQSLSGLESGEAWIHSPQWLGFDEPKRVRIRRARTFDSGATPKDVKGKRTPATMADVDLSKIRKEMASTIERAKAEDPRELRKRVAELERKLAAAEKAAPAPVVETKVVEKMVFREGEAERLDKAVWDLQAIAESIRGDVHVARITNSRRLLDGWTPPTPPVAVSRPEKRPKNAQPAAEISGVGQRILDALAELNALQASQPERELVALLSNYTNLNSKGFTNGIGSLRSGGFIDYPTPGTIQLTELGHSAANYPDSPRSSQEIQARVCSLLGGASARILEPLILAYPDSIARDDLAAAAGYGNLNSKGFTTAIGRLRTLGFIDYPERGTVAATSILFLEGSR